MANAPAKKFRIGFLSATVWRNEKPNGDGHWYSIELQRTYRDDDGNLVNTSSLNHADLLPAAHLLTKANAWVMEQ